MNGSRETRALALSGFIVPISFTMLVVVQGFLQPAYSHLRLPISALAAWPTGWMQNANFYITGTLVVAFSFAVHRAVRSTPWGWLGPVLLGTGGLGVVLAGLFPWTMVNSVPSGNAPHVVGAITAFGGTGLGLLVFAPRLRADSQLRNLAAYTMLSGVLVLVLFLTVGLFAVDDSAPLHSVAGLIQRLLVAVWFSWMIVMAVRVRSV